MPGLRRVLALAVALVVGSSAGPALAFCRKTTCETCPKDPATACPTGGRPIAWPGACVSYALEAAVPRQVSLADAEILLAQAFATWQDVTCPGTGRHPSIIVSSFGLSECARHEYDRKGGNANVVLFRDDEWTHVDAEDAVGLTATTYDLVTGDLVDADMEINGTVDLSSSSAAEPGRYDLLSILTHEAGHFLGLAHSNEPGATMNPIYMVGTDDFRSLSEDDVAGICAIYPPDRDAKPCNFTPHGGFASECALGVLSGGCSIGRGASRKEGGMIVALLLLTAAGRRSRRSAARDTPRASRVEPGSFRAASRPRIVWDARRMGAVGTATGGAAGSTGGLGGGGARV